MMALSQFELMATREEGVRLVCRECNEFEVAEWEIIKDDATLDKVLEAAIDHVCKKD